MESFVNIVITFIFSMILFFSRKNKINVCNNILIEKIYKKWYRKNAKEFKKDYLSNEERDKLYSKFIGNLKKERITLEHLKYHITIIDENTDGFNEGIKKVIRTFLGFVPIGFWIQSIIREGGIGLLIEKIKSGDFDVILIIFSVILAGVSCLSILNIDVANRETQKKYILKDTVKIWNSRVKKKKKKKKNKKKKTNIITQPPSGLT